jgi:hypothetical protein
MVVCKWLNGTVTALSKLVPRWDKYFNVLEN